MIIILPHNQDYHYDNQAMIGALVKWCLGRRQLAHSSSSKLHCDYLQVGDYLQVKMSPSCVLSQVDPGLIRP